MIQTRPSRLYLPKHEDSPGTIFEYLLRRFPQIDPDVWRERLSNGSITLSDGTRLKECSPYRHGVFVFYQKEVPFEPPVVEDPVMIYRDDEIIVVDKPHGMPVTPAGQHIERSLLTRLQRSTGLVDLTPVHRLDRETAGVLLLTIKRNTRGAYHQLFAQGTVEREYIAIAHAVAIPEQKHWRIENRMEPGEPWYRQKIGEGPVNAITEIEFEGMAAMGFARFRLFPKTGKKHQLRVHMASIGFPIVGDPFYPEIRQEQDGRVGAGGGEPPLQLLAARLAFVDPLTAAPRSFESSRHLQIS